MNIGLSAAELTAIRSSINELLPDTCNILSVTSSSDGEGGYSETWGTAATAVACRLDPIQQRERGYELVSAGAVQAFHQFVLTLKYDQAIAEGNRVEYGTVTYNVVSVDANKSWDASTRVILERLTNA